MTTHEQYEKEKRNTALNSLKCELLGARDRSFLIQSLARHLPAIGITTAAIVLFEDDKISCCVGGFSPRGISPQREQRFPARLLVPADLKAQYADGVFMVQPLFIENQSLGYFVHNVPSYDGVIFEEIRSAVSYALKGIFLLEELVRAQRMAQKAEQAKSEFLAALKNILRSPGRGIILTIGAPEDREYPWPGEGSGLQADVISIDSLESFDETVAEISPSLIVINGMNLEAAESVRRHPLTQAVPIVMIGGRIDSAADIAALSGYSRLLVCHRAAASAPEFLARLKALIGGDEILPAHTGALVKKTIRYFDTYAASPISRWKLAEAVHVSEDYLTRIFHREMGMSLWDYLNRYRVFLASALLRRTDEPIKEIAFRCGFQDQAYFCRVFRKLCGCSPGRLRKRSE
jgi:AraC-like DNA-binding protein